MRFADLQQRQARVFCGSPARGFRVCSVAGFPPCSGLELAVWAAPVARGHHRALQSSWCRGLVACLPPMSRPGAAAGGTVPGWRGGAGMSSSVEPPRAVGLCSCPRMLRCRRLQLCKATSKLLQDAPSWGALSRKPQTFSCPAPPHVLAVEAAKWPVPGKHWRRCGICWREGSYWGCVLAGWSGLLLGTRTGAGDSQNPCVGRGALAGAGKGCGAAVDCFLLGSP